jgi:ubiquinone/menaquinone biosynthesis C-methylase UbiE
VKSEFDQYRNNYVDVLQKAFVLPGMKPEFFLKIKADHILSTTQRIIGPSSDLNILDVGCGSGLIETFLVDRYRKITAIDVSRELLESAKKVVANVDFQFYDGKKMPFPDNSFDLVFSICVFHHIDHEHRLILLNEMKRVVRPGGCVAIYEHNPLNPLTRRTVANCEFDKNALLIGSNQLLKLLKSCGLLNVYKGYITFFPFKGKFFRQIEKWLAPLPLGAQFTVWARYYL